MRIAFFVDKFPALSETFILRQITGLIDRGHTVDIHVEVVGDESEKHREVDAYGLMQRVYARRTSPPRVIGRAAGSARLVAQNLHRAPWRAVNALNPFRFGRPAATGKLLQQAAPLIALDCPRYDVIHAHFAPHGLKAVQLRRLGVIAGPIITSFHGYDVNVGDPATLSRRYAPLFRQGDAYTANTKFTADKAAALGCPADRIHLLPESLNVADYTFRERKREADKPVRLLTVGRLVEKKGVEYAIRAVAQVKDRHPRIQYDIVGDGPLRGHLANLIDELGVGGHIRLLGAKRGEELKACFDAADLFLLPSVTASNGDKEGQALVNQEAQACGMPVITTRHNGIPDGVAEGSSAILVDEADVKGLADALSNLCDHTDQWPAMGRAGRRFVEQHFDTSVVNERLVELYAGLGEKAV